MLNLISLLPWQWVLVWRSHKFLYGLSRAVFGRTKLRRFYCLPYACVCWCQNNSNRYGWCSITVLRTKLRCGSRQ